MQTTNQRIKRFLPAMLALLILVLCLPTFSQPVSAALVFSNVRMANTNLAVGESCAIYGTVTSNNSYNIKYVRASIRDASTGKEVDYSEKNNINAKTFTIRSSVVDTNLKFGKRPRGSYYLQYTAVDSSGRTYQSSKVSFTVGKSNLAIKNVKLSKDYIPLGKPCNLSGTVTSNYKITTVRATIERYLRYEGQYKYVAAKEVAPKTLSVDLGGDLNQKVKFGELITIPGRYHLIIEAWDAQGNYASSKPLIFDVTGLKIVNAHLTTTTISYGNACNIWGEVWSSTQIKKVSAAVYKGNTVLYRGVDTSIHNFEEDIVSSKANKDIPFGKLARGSYVLEIYAEDVAGHTDLKRINFTVK